MPRKETEKTQKAPPTLQVRRGADSDEWGGFVQANLTPMDKALFEQWYSEHTNAIQPYLDEHIGSGLKLSVVFDGAHNSYIASYTGRPSVDENFTFRCTLSARAGEFVEALAVLVYKHVVICAGDWTDYLVNGSRVNNWG